MFDRYNEEEVLGFIEGDLTHEQKVEFEKKLVADPRLRNLVAHLVLDRHRLRNNLPDETAPPDVMEAVNQSIERHMLLGSSPSEPPTAPAIRMRFTRWAAVGGIAAMFVVVAMVVTQTLINPDILDLAGQQHAPSRPATGAPSPTSLASKELPAQQGQSGELPAVSDPSDTLAMRDHDSSKTLRLYESPLDEADLRRRAITGTDPVAAAEVTKGAMVEDLKETKTAGAASTDVMAAADQPQKHDSLPQEMNVARTGEGVALANRAAQVSEEHPSDFGLHVVAATPSQIAESVRAWASENYADVIRDAAEHNKRATETSPELTAETKVESDAKPEQQSEIRRMLILVKRSRIPLLADALKRQHDAHVVINAPLAASHQVEVLEVPRELAATVGRKDAGAVTAPPIDHKDSESPEKPAAPSLDQGGQISPPRTESAVKEQKLKEQSKEHDLVLLPIVIEQPESAEEAPSAEGAPPEPTN